MGNQITHGHPWAKGPAGVRAKTQGQKLQLLQYPRPFALARQGPKCQCTTVFKHSLTCQWDSLVNQILNKLRLSVGPGKSPLGHVASSEASHTTWAVVSEQEAERRCLKCNTVQNPLKRVSFASGEKAKRKQAAAPQPRAQTSGEHKGFKAATSSSAHAPPRQKLTHRVIVFDVLDE